MSEQALRTLTVESLDDRTLPSVIYAADFTWSYPAGETWETVSVGVTVTADAPGFTGLYLWEYEVTNETYGISSDPDTGLAFVTIPVEVYGDVSNLTNDIGWLGHAGPPLEDPNAATWTAPYGTGGPLLMPGMSGSFSFTTPPQGVADVGGAAGISTFYAAAGPAVGPGRQPTVDLRIQGLDDDKEEVGDGRRIHINDNIDELQYTHNEGAFALVPNVPVRVASDYRPNPRTNNLEIKLTDPDLVDASLTLGPAGTVGRLTWHVGTMVFWQQGGSWVPVTNQEEFTAPATPIALKVEGQLIDAQRQFRVDFQDKATGRNGTDTARVTIYTGVKVTGSHKADFVSQIGGAGAWTTAQDTQGNLWRHEWIGETEVVNFVPAQPWQLRVRSKLNPLFLSDKQVAVEAVWDKEVRIDNFDKKQVDPIDIAPFVEFESSYGGAIVTHVLVEQGQLQINSVKDYETAHATACEAEAFVYVGGGTRNVEAEPAKGSMTGTSHYRYGHAGVSAAIMFDWVTGKTNIANVRRP